MSMLTPPRLAILILIAGCRSTSAPQPTVEAALAHYATLAAAMEHDSVAALFMPDGELVTEGRPTIAGPDSIRNHLRSFVGYHVLVNELIADTTRATADTVYQAGTYRQQVQVPAGDTVEVHGRFMIDWVRDRDGSWRIRRMTTRPSS